MKRFIPALVVVGAAALTLVPVSLASASPSAHAAAFRADGKTAQGLDLVLLVASSGRRVQLQVDYQVTCDSGASFSDSETITGPSTPGGFRGHHISRV